MVTTTEPLTTVYLPVDNETYCVSKCSSNDRDLSSPSVIYENRLLDIVTPIMKEIGFPYIDQMKFGFSRPIDSMMAYADGFGVRVCPLFVIELSEIPLEIRPQNWEDPRLCDLQFLQILSDWIAEKLHMEKQKVSFVEAAAAKTIVKLKQDAEGIKALRAGIAHELGHVALGHCFENKKSSYEIEKEADLYAASHLPDGLEGIKIGFAAWQASLQAVRSNSNFSWSDRILMRILITPGGNLLPLYFSHGFFETRIYNAENSLLQDSNFSKKIP